MRRKILHLPVQLTEDELRSKGQQQAQAVIEYGQIETAKRVATADFGKKLKSKRADIDTLAQQIRTGLEVRPVECEVVPLYDAFSVVTIRRDTRERVDVRPMTDVERQMTLDSFEPDEDEDDENDSPH